MSEYIRVVNWPKFQHYKLPNPSWIKVYRSLLTDYDFTELPDDTKGHLVMLWLLAAETGNKIPNNHDWVERKINSKTKINFKLLTDLKFIEIYDSRETLEKLYKNSRAVEPNHSIPEKRREETETEDNNACEGKETLVDFLGGDESFRLAEQLWSLDPRMDSRTVMRWLPDKIKEVSSDFILGVFKTFLQNGGGPPNNFKGYLEVAIGKERAKQIGDKSGANKSSPRNYGYSDKGGKPYTGVTVNVD